ncbi:MAG: efflux RND transporter periplasmic adaptor subunit, partial [Bryobacteraceae bacterium]
YYKSTMIPGEVRETPGKDSMGMDMVPVYEDEAAAAEAATISIDPVTIQNMGIRTVLVTNGPLRRVIRTVGTIDYNEPALTDVTTKFKGWIEKLYVDATGQLVMKGDPLFEIYSPELYSAQTEYLIAFRGAPATDPAGRQALLQSARQKLKFFDISGDQVTELERTLEPRKTLRIVAPRDGFVIEKLAVEGQMVEAGKTLYRLADLGLVWVYAEVYEQDLPFVQLGQEAWVRLSYLPDRTFRGRVTYVYPTVDARTRTVRVRMEHHNPGYFLKPGMFVTVELVSELAPSVLLVPDTAVLRSGDRSLVFVAREGGRFEPRPVALGPRAENDLYQVLSGLHAGERVVTSGQFMLDSESQWREAIQKMLHPSTSGPAMTAVTTEAAAPAGTTPSAPGTPAAPEPHAYVCPMPEHVSIEYEHPGQCPLCGMALVPVTREMRNLMQPGGKVESYTCPMPEHSDVRLDKPGKCPKCGMTLIPVMPRPGRSGPPARAEPPSPELYTCPMASHAEVVSDHPGPCPKCEMDLVPTSAVAHGRTAERHWRQKRAIETSEPEGTLVR